MLDKWKKQCSICGHRFNMLNRHLNVAHRGGRHRCKICPCAFHKKSGLVHHIRLKHADGKRTESLSKRSLTRPKNISKVSASKLFKRAAISRLNSKAAPPSFPNTSNKPAVGKFGSRKFNKSSSSNVIRVICEECGNTVLKRHLEKHLQSQHRGGRFACDLCPCSAFSVAALTNHKRRHYANESQTIPTYLTQLKQQENENEGLRISSFRRSSSVEILDDNMQEASTSRESSCSREIPTTFRCEGSTKDSSRIVLIETDLSDKPTKQSLGMETPGAFQNLPTAAALATNQQLVMSASLLVAQNGVHQHCSTSSSEPRKLYRTTSNAKHAAEPHRTSLVLQGATGKNLVDFRTEVQENVTYCTGQDSGIVSDGEPRREQVLNADFSGHLPSETSRAIPPSTGMQVQPPFPTCHVCNAMFVSPAALTAHVKIHETVCGYCGKTVPTLDIVTHIPNSARTGGR